MPGALWVGAADARLEKAGVRPRGPRWADATGTGELFNNPTMPAEGAAVVAGCDRVAMLPGRFFAAREYMFIQNKWFVLLLWFSSLSVLTRTRTVL